MEKKGVVKSKGTIFKKIEYLETEKPVSFSIIDGPDNRRFHTLGVYRIDDKGKEHLLNKLSTAKFKQIVKDHIINEVKY